ncbi:MAG: hypothetical protein AAFR04_01295 [Pseudomonadota bacterium]
MANERTNTGAGLPQDALRDMTDSSPADVSPVIDAIDATVPHVAHTAPTQMVFDVAAADFELPQIQALLKHAPAVVILELGPSPVLDETHAAALVAAVRATETVALLRSSGDLAHELALANRIGADGLHRSDDASAREHEWGSDDDSVDVAALRAALGRDRVIGIEPGGERHAAMVLAETDLDYLAFRPAAPAVGARPGANTNASPDFTSDVTDDVTVDVAGDVTGDVPSTAPTAPPQRHAHALWWAQIFQVPCMALDVVRPEEAAFLASRGVEFIALPLDGTQGDDAIAACADAIARGSAQRTAWAKTQAKG